MIKFNARRIVPLGSPPEVETETFRGAHPSDGAYAFEQFLNRLKPAKYLLYVNDKRMGYYTKDPE